MNTTGRLRYLALLALALAALGAVAAQASAHGRGDRQARIDSDKDSASNRCERQAGLDNSKTDTDDNGTIDGLEDSDGDGANNAAESRMRTNCGVANKRFKIKRATVASYSDEDGLTLKIGKRGLITASVSAKVVCEQDDVTTDDSSLARHGEGESGDDRGEDDAGDDRRGRGRDDGPGDDRPRDDRGSRGENDESDTVACTTADLTEGAEVVSAKTKNGRFTRIHLAAADAGDF